MLKTVVGAYKLMFEVYTMETIINEQKTFTLQLLSYGTTC